MKTTLREVDRSMPVAPGGVAAPSDLLRRNQLARLLRIVVALQGDRCPNTRQLADECEVSRRTIFRDLETIEMAGILIIYDATRQGYRLDGSAGTAPLPVEDEEAETFLTLLCRWGGTDPRRLVGQARAGMVQLLPAISDFIGPEGVNAIRVDDLPRTSSAGPSSRRGVFDGLLEAVSTRRRLSLVVKEPIPEPIVASGFFPYRIVLGQQGWGIVGHFERDGLVRLIPFASIDRASVTEEPAEIPPRFSLGRWLERSGTQGPARSGRTIRLRVTPDLAALLNSGEPHPSRRIEREPGGWAELHLTVDEPDELVGWILGHGGEIEVMEPTDLRRRVRAAAIDIARRHRERPPTDPRERDGISPR